MKSDLYAFRGLIRRIKNIVFGYRKRGKGAKQKS